MDINSPAYAAFYKQIWTFYLLTLTFPSKSKFTDIFLLFVFCQYNSSLRPDSFRTDPAGLCLSQGHSSVILLVQFWDCLFFPSPQPEGKCNAPNTPHPETDTKTILQSLIHVRRTGALNYKIKPAAHESIKLKYKIQ